MARVDWRNVVLGVLIGAGAIICITAALARAIG
jgi:hypothetical protein